MESKSDPPKNTMPSRPALQSLRPADATVNAMPVKLPPFWSGNPEFHTVSRPVNCHTVSRPVNSHAVSEPGNCQIGSEPRNCPKPVGQQAVSNPSADKLSQTNPSLSPTAPGPNLSDNKLSKTCRTTSCPKPVGQQAVSNPSADKLSQTSELSLTSKLSQTNPSSPTPRQ